MNLTSDGGYTYTWDAENRLTCVTPASPNDDSKKVMFAYDYLGRRVWKALVDWNPALNGGAGGWEATTECERLFVYHGWLLLMELDALNDNAVIREYTWGLDLSNDSLDEAGGIGGLLACYDTNGTTSGADPTADDEEYIYFYDANGNVGQMIAWASGYGGAAGYAWHADRMVAKYEYDAYGNSLLDPSNSVESGPYAANNPFRFSTKYWDDETGLGYWGYRYYSPRLGRWISRDLMEESGDLNMQRFGVNRPVDVIDIFGLWPNSIHSILCRILSVISRVASINTCRVVPALGGQPFR